MKPSKSLLFIAAIAALFALARPTAAQLVAYDDAGNYLVTANWTNGANGGFGFTPWALVTNGPDSHGTYVTAPAGFAINSVTNILGTNYTSIWGVFANGLTDVNETAAFRGFANPLGTHTFKLQWGARGAGVTTTTNAGAVHGWCGFTLRNGNQTNSSSDFGNGVMFYLYFLTNFLNYNSIGEHKNNADSKKNFYRFSVCGDRIIICWLRRKQSGTM